jgi:hypothetical protein
VPPVAFTIVAPLAENGAKCCVFVIIKGRKWEMMNRTRKVTSRYVHLKV